MWYIFLHRINYQSITVLVLMCANLAFWYQIRIWPICITEQYFSFLPFCECVGFDRDESFLDFWASFRLCIFSFVFWYLATKLLKISWRKEVWWETRGLPRQSTLRSGSSLVSVQSQLVPCRIFGKISNSLFTETVYIEYQTWQD